MIIAFLEGVLGPRLTAWLLSKLEKYLLQWVIALIKRAVLVFKRNAQDKKDTKKYEEVVADPKSSVDQKSDAAVDFLNNHHS